MGKTQLIRHVFEQPSIKDNYYTFYTDNYPTTSLHELVLFLSKEMYSVFLAPFMLGLYWRGVTTASVWACFAWGVGLTVVNMLLGNPINPINCGAIAMLGGFPVVWLVSLLTPKMNREEISRFFECYQ